MFSMASLTAVIAVTALATTAIVSVSVTQDEGAPPGAEAVTISEDVSRFYQGSWRLTGFVDSGETTEHEDGVVLKRLRGQIYEGTIESTDDRIAGTTTGTLNQESHAFPSDWIQPAITQWGTERIENDGGAWECTWSGGEMQVMVQQRLLWCVGEGDYDGFAMRMLWTMNNDGAVDLEGLAWQGELPPLQSPTGA
jgi:hypothetical protein